MRHTAKHTPGPFSVFHNEEHDETYIYAGDERIATVRRDIPAYEANAALFAGAPDLFLQLKLLVRWAEDQGEKCTFAKAALAQAEGSAK